MQNKVDGARGGVAVKGILLTVLTGKYVENKRTLG